MPISAGVNTGGAFYITERAKINDDGLLTDQGYSQAMQRLLDLARHTGDECCRLAMSGVTTKALPSPVLILRARCGGPRYAQEHVSSVNTKQVIGDATALSNIKTAQDLEKRSDAVGRVFKSFRNLDAAGVAWSRCADLGQSIKINGRAVSERHLVDASLRDWAAAYDARNTPMEVAKQAKIVGDTVAGVTDFAKYKLSTDPSALDVCSVERTVMGAHYAIQELQGRIETEMTLRRRGGAHLK